MNDQTHRVISQIAFKVACDVRQVQSDHRAVLFNNLIDTMEESLRATYRFR